MLFKAEVGKKDTLFGRGMKFKFHTVNYFDNSNENIFPLGSTVNAQVIKI